ncbi:MULTISPECIES: TIGR04168 family protein [unclassified Prochlorococcus]|uniref:TIGR04168 family protein n=1 Tax=unclassified Prochlorococcus TaxID=2627481 RepID=UPI00315DF0D6
MELYILFTLTIIRIAIAGDLHGEWSHTDNELVHALNPDAILFVGDLDDGQIRIAKIINDLSIPTGIILGNHDKGIDTSGHQLKSQLDLLGDKDCGWGNCSWENLLISVVGARPCSAGGGYYLSEQVKSVYGHISIEESVDIIVNASRKLPSKLPLIILAHSGPTGLGSEVSSLCGRDWKAPSIDWGDKDLELSIDKIKKERSVDLVVFGHMHHELRRGRGIRDTFYIDSTRGIAYLNAACVPRKGIDSNGTLLTHFSWVEFFNGKLMHASHRWYRDDFSLAYKEDLLN